MSRIGRVMTVAGLSASVAGCSFGINSTDEGASIPSSPEALCVPVETTINSFGVLTTQRETETLEEYYSRLA